MQIKVFERCVPAITDSSIPPEELVPGLTGAVIRMLQQAPSYCFPVNTTEINDRAQVHCEKWVEEVGLHFVQYATAAQAPDLNFPVNQSANRMILKNKVYSGDVSGTIGEALFSIYLSKYCLLSEGDFAHLRADKTSGVYPDFEIFVPSQEMLSHFGWVVPPTIQIPAEVKNANEPNRASIYPRLLRAIQQIRNFWNRRNEPFGPSLIGLTVRDPNARSYDLVIIWR